MIARLPENLSPRAAVVLLLLLLALLVAPLFANDYLLTVLILIFYFAYTGQAWNIMMGFAGQLSLGHAIYIGLGAYTTAVLFSYFGISPWLGSFAAILLAMLCGAMIGFLAFRFRVAGVYFAILTIAFAEFARIGFDHLTYVGGSAGFFLPVANYTQSDLWTLRGKPIMFYYLSLGMTVAAVILCHIMIRSRIGYFWQAIREDEEAARAVGINTFRYKLIAVVISAAMTSLAGVFFAFYYNNLFPEEVFSINRSIELILAPIFGGLGTLFGPILGAFMLTGLAETLTTTLAALGVDVPGAKQVFYGILPVARDYGLARRRVALALPAPGSGGAAQMSVLLSIDDISKRFRGLLAVDRLSFQVNQGEIFAVIGPNGAGKTTLFNMIAGVFSPDSGTIVLSGERIDGLSPDRICRRGIGRTFQIVRPFPALSVEDNVIVAALLHRHLVPDARAHAGEVLRQLDLYDKRAQQASGLTLPDRKRLELARALATDPKLLLLDEVMAGLRPTETDRMVAILKELNRSRGLTILLIEHVMRAVMALAARVLVMHHGAAIAEGTPDEVVRNRAVIESYLGAETVA